MGNDISRHLQSVQLQDVAFAFGRVAMFESRRIGLPAAESVGRPTDSVAARSSAPACALFTGHWPALASCGLLLPSGRGVLILRRLSLRPLAWLQYQPSLEAGSPPDPGSCRSSTSCLSSSLCSSLLPVRLLSFAFVPPFLHVLPLCAPDVPAAVSRRGPRCFFLWTWSAASTCPPGNSMPS